PSLEKVILPQLGLTVWGSAFTSEDKYEDPLKGFAPDEDNINIVLLHAELTSTASKYCPVSPESIDASGADYVALGHIHKTSSGVTPSGTVWAWPGCPEGRGFDETGDKGVIIAEVSKHSAKLRFERMSSARYFDIEVTLKEGDDPVEKCVAALSECEKRDICRIIFKGESRGVDVQAVKTAAEHLVEVYSVKDKTRPSRDLFECEIAQSLKGRFLAKMKQLYEGANTEEEQKSAALAAVFGIAALEGRQPPLGGAYYED
ncbi:MAG: DNA repair exonuclease, partial [Oscillospiraceae bacterium]|nr:DNA repair exonuclease [Oscillospiraceae bacterium]